MIEEGPIAGDGRAHEESEAPVLVHITTRSGRQGRPAAGGEAQERKSPTGHAIERRSSRRSCASGGVDRAAAARVFRGVGTDRIMTSNREHFREHRPFRGSRHYAGLVVSCTLSTRRARSSAG